MKKDSNVMSNVLERLYGAKSIPGPLPTKSNRTYNVWDISNQFKKACRTHQDAFRARDAAFMAYNATTHVERSAYAVMADLGIELNLMEKEAGITPTEWDEDEHIPDMESYIEKAERNTHE